MSDPVPDPITGELLDLAEFTDNELAALIDKARDQRSRLNETVNTASEVLHDRMDRSRLWTIDAGEWKISGQSDEPRAVWDADRLQLVLLDLVGTGVLDADAADRAINVTVTRTVAASGVKALLKSPALAASIEECREFVEPAARRIKLTRRP